MKRFYSAIILAFMVSGIFAGCELLDASLIKDDGVTLTLRVDEVGQDIAHVRLTHDGSGEDYWYCMNSTNLDADARGLLERQLSDVLKEKGEIEAQVGVNRNVIFSGLKAKTDYRVIAARINEYGKIVGNVAEATYRTMRDPAVFEKKGNWVMSYKERKMVSEDDESEIEVFSCLVEGDTTETFVPMILSKDDFRDYYGEIEDVTAVRSCFEEYVEFCNSSNTKWSKQIRNKTCEYTQERLRSDDYWLFMIGITKDGDLTGYYSCNEHKLIPEQAEPGFMDWVGVWRISEIVPSAESVTYEVTIKAEENNLYLRMYGWEKTAKLDEALREVPDMCPVLLYYEKSTGDVYVISEELNDLGTVAEADFYDFFLYGLVSLEEGDLSMINLPNLRLARMALNEGRQSVTFTPERFTYSEDGKAKSAEFEGFCYVYTMTIWPELTPLTPDLKVIRINNLKMERIGS